MTQLTLNGKPLLLVPVPEGTIQVCIDDITKNLRPLVRASNGYLYSPSIYLPPGDWQLIGKDPLNLSEEEAREIVEEDGTKGNELYKDYMYVPSFVNPITYCENALESLSSLLRANQMEKAIFLINKTK